MNKGNIRILLSILLATSLSACSSAEKQPENARPAPAAADNTAQNERDSTGATTTPGDQGQNDADLRITANIRQAVVDDKALSVNAGNVKIVTTGGVVTLRGPVKSQQEKSAIEGKAKQVAGVTRVDNQLEIAPPQ